MRMPCRTTTSRPSCRCARPASPDLATPVNASLDRNHAWTVDIDALLADVRAVRAIIRTPSASFDDATSDFRGGGIAMIPPPESTPGRSATTG